MMFVFKCVPGIVIDGVPTNIASRKEFPPPKCKGSNSTFTHLHKEINSNKDNVFVNKTFLLRIEKLFDHLFFKISDQYFSLPSPPIKTIQLSGS